MKQTTIFLFFTYLCTSVACGGTSVDPEDDEPDASIAVTCDAPMMDCAGDCIDTSADDQNCGACDNVCGADQTCTNSVCECDMPGFVACGGTCIDPATDNDFCGAGADCAANPGSACGAESGCDASTCQPRLANGSFETGDYAGWTLADDSGVSTTSVWAVLPTATDLSVNPPLQDLQDNETVTPSCYGLPHPPATVASAGANAALHMQGGAARHTMTQDFYIFPGETTLSFDMLYLNTQPKDDLTHFIAVNILDPADNALLATAFKTAVGDPDDVPNMTSFSGDVTAFAGQMVRLEFELMIQAGCWTINFDNFRVE